MTDVEWARREADRWVRPIGRRWYHVTAVATLASEVARASLLDAGLLVAAAWLHDVGYAPGLVDTGFHPVDGARHLRRLGADERIVSLVAHHSYARIDASQRGLERALIDEFPAFDAVYDDALCTCDMTRGPSGEVVSAADRLDEIETRYGPGHHVTRWAQIARPEILAAVARTEERMRVSESAASRR